MVGHVLLARHSYVGMGGAPFVRHLSWGSWAGPAATTRSGQIAQQWPCGKPIYQCPASVRPVNVYLHDVQTHGGNPYFAKMRWSWVNSKGKARMAYWLHGDRGQRASPGRPGRRYLARSAARDGPTWLASQSLSGRVVRRKVTTRSLAAVVSSHSPAGHSCQATSPLCRSSPIRG